MIYVTGDLHGQITRLTRAPLSAADILIVCGDFGFACHGDADSDFGLAWLANQPYTVLFIDGNHDNHDWLDSLPVELRYGGTVHRVRDRIFHLMRGQVYRIEGRTFFALGGAASTDREYRESRGLPWWERELPDAGELALAAEQLDRVGWRVDAVLTHTAPREAIRALGGRPYPAEKPLTDFLDALFADLDFSVWFFGHWHTDCDLGGGMYAVHEDIRVLTL